MPVVLRFRGFRVVIYTEDHRPSHVHVQQAGCEAVFNLNCPDGPIALRQREGFSFREVNGIERWMQEYVTDLCEAWEEIHGIDD